MIVADDLVSINLGMLSVLKTLKVADVLSVQYCDDAYLKIKKSYQDQQPYDLLITDLSFKKDHRDQEYASGEELVAAIHNEFPDLKIIVYSIEDRIQRTRKLIREYGIKAYVCKGRRGLDELTEAINLVYANQLYVSEQVAPALSKKSHLEIDDFDILIVKYLSEGLSQDQISQQLRNDNLFPNSLSTIEKRLNKLRIQFKANNVIHLVAIVKDLGLI
ncbi:response regulator [Xanthomarina sp.]|uniref:DNA-binding response regulator n=1 Tax=Xanthomarina sp. TaxID=1931211 RepID=UPI002D1FBB63|nr:response regulator [Xanthomarina sp.]